MNKNLLSEGQKALQARIAAGAETVYKDLDAAKATNTVLAEYGRVWLPSDGEVLEFEENPACVFYKRGKTSHGLKIWGHSNLTGWDFYPVEWSGDMPDVKDEREILFKDSLNSETTMRGNAIDRARLLAKAGKVRIEEVVLHGPTWATKDDGTRVRIPDAIDKEDRAERTYFKIVKA